MSGKILLFGFDSLMNVLALEAAVKPFGVELVPVARRDYHKTLGVLAGLDTASEAPLPYQGGSLGGRMLVLCDLKDKLDELLPVLRQSGAGPECLKAVLTEHNRRWNVLALHKELLREQEEMRRLKR